MADPELITNFGSFLFNRGHTQRAEALYRKALVADPNVLVAKDRLENLAASLLPRWHFPMLNDTERNLKFEAAIEKSVREGGRTVLDLGAGTGLLSLMAARAGADRVYACEASEVMAMTCREVLLQNPEGSRVRLIPQLSLDMDKADIPEQVDILVTETFDAGLLGEHVLESLAHAWKNFLTPGHSKVVPAKAEFITAPVECVSVGRGLSLETETIGYLDVSSTRLSTDASEPYNCEKLDRVEGGFKLLAKPQTLFSVNFEDPAEIASLIEGKLYSLKFNIEEDGKLDCLAAWFNLDLGHGQTISTSPES